MDRNPNIDTWKLDVSGCGLEEFAAWTEYGDLEVLDLSDNNLVELPGWLWKGRMRKLRELRARGNKLEAFVNGMLRGTNETNLALLDLRDNAIAQLPYEIMNVESEKTTLLIDGNPCAEELDWSGLGVDRLPVRMVEEGYDNGGWEESLKRVRLAHNMLGESVFGELVAANFTNIEELDVGWNRLMGLPELHIGELGMLRRLDVSGHAEGIKTE